MIRRPISKAPPVGARRMRVGPALDALWRDERGQAETTAWLVTVMPYWFLVTLIIVICLVGYRQAGAASIAHLAARRAGTGTLAAGQQVIAARGAVWGVPESTLASDRIQHDTNRRSVRARVHYAWESGTFIGRVIDAVFHIDVYDLERREGFYAGPPADWE